MSYKLNNIDLSAYGIIPGRIEGSNISLAGCFNMPQRLGDTFHDWGDENGIEPFVANEDMIFAGRDITFNGHILGTRAEVNTQLQLLYALIDSFTGLVVFSSPYGDFKVTVKSIDPEFYHNIGTFTMVMREPIVSSGITNYALMTANGDRMLDPQGNHIIIAGRLALPPTGNSPYTIDGIPFASFGLFLQKPEGLHGLAEPKEPHVTSIGEAWQITKRQGNDLIIRGHIAGTSLSDFKTKAGYLYVIFTKSGTRTIIINNEVRVVCFACNGYTLENIYLYDNAMVASIQLTLTIETIEYL